MNAGLPGVALITGAGGNGIGHAVAHSFAREGCKKIVLTDIKVDALESTTQGLKSKYPDVEILSIVNDVTDPTQVDELFTQILNKFGRLDYAVNNAGVLGAPEKSSDMSIENFDRVNNVNYRGVFLCSRKELQIMRDQEFPPGVDGAAPRTQRGSIVNLASVYGVMGRAEAPSYCASKSAVIGLTRCDAIDHAKYKIRVNAVCPGIIGTSMTRRPGLVPGTTDPYAWLAKDLEALPIHRVGLAEEIADIVLFLASEKASIVQGAAWVADGGYMLQ